MLPKFKVTEIYCMADDFCKEFVLQQEKYMIEDKKQKYRNNSNRMNDTNILQYHSCRISNRDLILLHSPSQ